MSNNIKNLVIYSSIPVIICTGVTLGAVVSQYVTIKRIREKRKYLKFI
jgi:hypothetical protein